MIRRLVPLLSMVLAVVAGGAAMPAAAGTGPTEPYQAYSVPVETLDAALDCTDLNAHPDKEPVLLVHGTFTAGHEQFDWNYALELADRGFDFCLVTYPNRGFDDMQVSAEYVARAIEVMHDASGRAVDVMGHSQGALLPRWAVKWFPQAARAADDLVLVAGPNHGTSVAATNPFGSSPAAFWQFQPGSDFIEALNRGDETPGDIDYTSLYSTLHDELVQPDGNVPGQTATAVLDHGIENPRVANLTPQQLCPGRPVDHLTIGTTDLVSIDLVLDAFTHDGPADLERLDPVTTCIQGNLARPDQLPAFLALLEGGNGGFPEFDRVDGEPDLMPYARPAGADGKPNGSGTGSSAGADDGTDALPDADPASDAVRADPDVTAASAGGQLAVTGPTWPHLAGFALLILAVGVRALLPRGT